MASFSQVVAPAHEPVTQAEAAAYLKLEHDYDADMIAALIRSAREACELFTGQALIHRDVRLSAVHQGLRFFLRGAPVVQILEASWSLGGAQTALDPQALSLAEHAGRDYVELPDVPLGAIVSVTYRMGLSAEWNGVPETLRLGILRLIAHQYETRSDPGVAALPGAVTALWQPYRRVAL